MSTVVTRSIEIEASAAEAFDAFTRVSDLLSWWCEGALVGLRPDGNWAIGFTDQRGRTEATVLGKIREFEIGSRLVVRDISYEPALGEPLEGLAMTLTFEGHETEAAVSCVVTVDFDVPDRGPAYDQYRGDVGSGWESSLRDLKSYLEGPRMRRFLIENGLPEN